MRVRAALAVFFLFLAVGKAAPAAAAEREPWRPGRLDFSVAIDGLVSDLEVLGVFVMPGERVGLTLLPPNAGDRFVIVSDGGAVTRRNAFQAHWQAPTTPGDYRITIVPEDGGAPMQLNAFVMVPATAVREGRLNGYRIGAYPATALKGLPIYQPPEGFVEVTPRNRDRRIAPHFRLGEFVSKQGGSYPRYVVLRETLLLKLELILEKLNEAGVATNELVVMSGYRTPHYNGRLGNVAYSRHQWGGAADIYVDVNPRDGRMDDLNRDGRVNEDDADWLYRLVDGLYGEPHYMHLVGGLGRYRANAAHGPFVHVDVRGSRSRWGF